MGKEQLQRARTVQARIVEKRCSKAPNRRFGAGTLSRVGDRVWDGRPARRAHGAPGDPGHYFRLAALVRDARVSRRSSVLKSRNATQFSRSLAIAIAT